MEPAVGIDLGSARERVRVARALPQLPRITGAFTQGVDLVQQGARGHAVATPENDADLLDICLHGTAAHVERVVREYRKQQRADDAEAAARRHPRRYHRVRYDDDGMLCGSFRLPPEEGAPYLAAPGDPGGDGR